jgi:hypothetical protein
MPPPPPAPALTLEETARRLGHYRWIERRLFEVMGGWVQSVPEVDVKLALATHGPKHAWHAQLWTERAPLLAHLAVGDLTVPPGDGVAAFMEAVAEPAGEHSVERLVGAYRVVVPRLATAYDDHLRAAVAVSDAPVMRALGLALADEWDDWREGEALIQRLLRGEEEVARAAAHQDRLERLLVRAGGITGGGAPVAEHL